MRLGIGPLFLRTALATAIALSAAILVAPGAAVAATDDSFTVTTTGGCGSAEFVDHGPGAPGGPGRGTNDDYLVIHDYCADGHGVGAAVTINDTLNLTAHNGNGLAGPAEIWDPFRDLVPRNIAAGDLILLKVCLYDGPADETGARCASASKRSVDG